MESSSHSFLHKLTDSSPTRLLIGILAAALILGVGTGYILANGRSNSTTTNNAGGNTPPKTAAADNRTFRDFAVGTIQKKPIPSNGDFSDEGTHLLIRDKAVPVALTSSVVDLDQYISKKVKVYGETQKAVKEGWLMDVGKVEVQ